MFDAENAGLALAKADARGDGDILEEIIWESGLPEAVRLAPISYVATRRIDAAEIDRLSGEQLNPTNCPAMAERLKRRRKALGRLLGEDITCVVVRVPGAAYTFEISLEIGSIVHWEWQAN